MTSTTLADSRVGTTTSFGWVWWLLLGAASIHIMELLYRLRAFDEFFSLETLATLEPLRILAGLGLFYGFRRAPTFLMGWATFICFIVISRVMVSMHAGEAFNVDTLLGLVLMVCGLYATTVRTNGRLSIGIGLGLLAGAGLWSGSSALRVLAVDHLVLDWWMGALLVAAVAIAISEYVARKGKYERFFPRYYMMMLPFSFVTNWGLYYGYTHALPTFMFAWAVYTIFDVVIRIANNYFMKEAFIFSHGLGMLLIVSGTLLTYIGGMTL